MALVKKALIIEQFINILLIFRPYIQELPLYLYSIILLAFFVLRHTREGNTPSVVTQILTAIVIIIGQMIENKTMVSVGVFMGVISYALQPTIYHLPEQKHKVNLRQHSDNIEGKNFYWVEWFGVQDSENGKKYEIEWARTNQLQKMAQYIDLNSPLLKKVINFVNSSAEKIRIKLCEGNPTVKEETNIIFCHGRGATPFMYSLMIRQLAKDYRILSGLHSDVKRTIYTDMDEIKAFRQKEVVERAKDVQYLAENKVSSSKIILIGHSYGCATILQAYQKKEVRNKVQKIILLDPWLFPLKEEVLMADIDCPILLLPNEYLVAIEDIYTRNLKFFQRHQNITYICWRKGDHLHQTDMGFVVGNTLWQIKHAEESNRMLEMNVQVMRSFMNDDEKDVIEEKYKDWNLGIDYKPKKWNNYLNF